MQKSVIKCAVITLAAMIAFAQTPSGNPPPGPADTQQKRPGATRHLEHLAQVLGLSDSQKEQAGMIFQQARESAQPIREELTRNRARLTAATKEAASDVDIQRLANEQGRLMGRLVAIRAQASSRFYRILTSEQRVKAEQIHEQFREHPEEHETGP